MQDGSHWRVTIEGEAPQFPHFPRVRFFTTEADAQRYADTLESLGAIVCVCRADVAWQVQRQTPGDVDPSPQSPPPAMIDPPAGVTHPIADPLPAE